MERDRGVLDGYHLGEALGPIASLLGRRCGIEAVKLLATRLAQSLGEPEDDHYSYIWRPAVEEHEQNINSNEYRAALLEALRDTAIAATETTGDAAAQAVQLLLTSPYPTLVRVGIFVCAENYPVVGEDFWQYFESNWLIKPIFWHELYWLLKKNYKRFSVSQRLKLLSLVRDLQGEWQGEDRASEWDDRLRRDILHPVIGFGDEEVESFYSQLVDRWGPVREHPDFHAYHGTTWVGERSPVSSDSLLAMSASELVKVLREFKPEVRSLDGPTYRGLASAISNAVRASDDGFLSKLALFLDLNRSCQHGVLNGIYHRLVDDKKPVDWNAVHFFIETIVNDPSFRTDLKVEDLESWEPSIVWVVCDIADLLKVSATDVFAVSRDFLDRGLRVLKQILNVIAPTPAAELKSPVSHTINSPRGRTLEAIVNIALAMRRPLEDLHLRNEVWELVGPTFEIELDDSVRGANGEFATIAGLYCTNLHFLNGTWVELQFDRIFSNSNEAAWKCTAEGFAYQRYLYDWLFKRLRDGGHLRRMIWSPHASKEVVEKALQFLSLAYLEGYEDLESIGMLRGIVDDLEVTRLTQICWFFWSLRPLDDGGVSGRSNKILKFWRFVSDSLRRRSQERPEILSALNQLAPFIQELDEQITILWSEAARYAQVKHHGNVLLENLARLSPKYPKQVFQVFQSALTKFLPDFEEEDVIRCTVNIAEAGFSDDAEWLCNEYARQGSNLLKSTYEKLRGRQEIGFLPSAND